MKEIAFIQPYVPHYRVPFFAALRSQLAREGIDLSVYTISSKSTDAAGRGDAAQASWIKHFRHTEVKFGKHAISIPLSFKPLVHADFLVVPLQGSTIASSLALIFRSKRKATAVWGHIKNYVNSEVWLDHQIEMWQMRRARHVFAYTSAGAQYAERCGIPRERVSAVNNTIDTWELQSRLRQISAREVHSFKQQHDLSEKRCVCYIGGLDASKRVDFLAEALDRIWLMAPDISLLLGGRGSEEGLLDRAVERGQVVRLGYVGGDLKARVLACSSAIVMPGRVGLIAVEALIAGVPIITTRIGRHAPEVEYLNEGQDIFMTDKDDTLVFAQEVLRVVEERSSEGVTLFSSEPPTLEKMAATFMSVLLAKGAQPDGV